MAFKKIMSISSDNNEKRVNLFHGWNGGLTFNQLAQVTRLAYYAN
jgi:hypothetical protein